MVRSSFALKLLHLLVFLLLAFPRSLAAGGGISFSLASYQLPGGLVEFSSPTLADLTGDGWPEVLIGTTTHNGLTNAYDRPAVLVAMQSNGTILWARNLGAPINSAPAVGDLDGDRQLEVVASFGGDVIDVKRHGGIAALNANGDILWLYNTQDHNGDGFADGVFSSPTLCDLEGDGKAEIIFGGWDQRIYLLDHMGRSLWNNLPSGFPGPGYYNADTIWSTAACADLNRDGFKEIIIGADITGGGILPDGTHTQDGGFLYIFSRNGSVLVRRYLPEAIYASPAVGDLDGDGSMELVSGTGWYWWDRHNRREQPYVYVFDTSRVFDQSRPYTDPEKLPYFPGWPQPTDYPGFSSPALGDLDGNGDLEIVIATSHPDLPNDPIAGSGSIYAWHHTGELVAGWPVHPKNWQNYDGPIFSSPTLADINGDERPEVLFSMLWDVQVYASNGIPMTPLGTYWTVWGSPAVGDTDGDGKMEIWIGGSKHQDVGGDPSSGYLWRFESTVGDTGANPWPMFHRDPQHTGYYPQPPRLSVSPASLYVLHQYGSGDTETAYLWLRNIGDGMFHWAVSNQPSGVTVSPSSGIIFYTSTLPATVTVSTAGYLTGTYSLGNLVITATGDGSPVQNSPFNVPVTLYVGQVHRAYLPIVLRR